MAGREDTRLPEVGAGAASNRNGEVFLVGDALHK